MIVLAILTRTIGGCIMDEDAWRKIRASIPKQWAVNGKAYPVTSIAAGRLGEIRLALEVPESDLLSFYGQGGPIVGGAPPADTTPVAKKKRGRPPKVRPVETPPVS